MFTKKNPYLQGPASAKGLPSKRIEPPTLQRAQEMEQLASPPKSNPVPSVKVGAKTKPGKEQTSFPGIHHEDIT